MEKWRATARREGYEVSSCGRVRSISRTVLTATGPRNFRGVLLSPRPNTGGYLCVRLGRGYPVMVHQLVAEAFLGPAPYRGAQVRHKDGDKTNNRKANLAWGTPKENQADRKSHGTHIYGSQVHCAVLTERDVVRVKKLLLRGLRHADIALMFGVTRGTVTAISSGRNWKHVKE